MAFQVAIRQLVEGQLAVTHLRLSIHAWAECATPKAHFPELAQVFEAVDPNNRLDEKTLRKRASDYARREPKEELLKAELRLIMERGVGVSLRPTTFT